MKMKRALTALILIFTICLFYPRTATSNEPNGENTEGAWIKLTTEATYFSSLETTPWGIMAGERDSRTQNKPHNGIWVSGNLGESWKRSGLEGRGVTDIKYYDRKLYATTYYTKNYTNGLFFSDDGGRSWSHLGNSFPASRVDRDHNTIYVGGYSHGLWISQDSGQTWQQKIGTGWYGPEINEITSASHITLVSTSTKIYKTEDFGNTWEEIPYLNGKIIRHFLVMDSIIYAGSSETSSLYKSTDLGATWEKVTGFGNHRVAGLTYYKGVYYAGKINPDGKSYSIYQSADEGLTWQNTNLNSSSAVYSPTTITWLFSLPSYLFTILSSQGIYRYQIPKTVHHTLPFLSVPWAQQKEGELIDRITSYFDHQYPLLGYGHYQEPPEERDTTLNFFGVKDKQPYLYYSSHDGTDYSLPYGTDILAASSGYAFYSYCSACGHTIKIDHQNGYLTTYMHLQETGLIVNTTDNKVWVEEGDVIGKVGMTGNTTGPHLHFSVMKDVNNNQRFDDDRPHGRVDPYSWQTHLFPDPWPLFNWTDALGTHQGTESLYLWKVPIKESSGYLNNESASVSVDNKTLELDPDDPDSQYSAVLKPYSKPNLSELQQYNGLRYISNTSVLINLFDNLGLEIKLIPKPCRLIFDLSNEDLSSVINETLKVYYWNEISAVWEALPGFYDQVNKLLTAETEHFSHFAVMGEPTNIPVFATQIEVAGEQSGGWFLTTPTVSFSVEADEASGMSSELFTVFYTTDNELTWETYQDPFEIQKEGVFTILYRAMDSQGNLEPTKDLLLKVDTLGKWSRSLGIAGGQFSVPL
jgi:murein DD-endopeptidase MepM/ murein hydrolase activator NlpD